MAARTPFLKMKKTILLLIVACAVVGCSSNVPGSEASAKESAKKATEGPMARYTAENPEAGASQSGQ